LRGADANVGSQESQVAHGTTAGSAGPSFGAGASAFRISRTPANGPPLEVSYSLTAFGPQGISAAQDGVATIAASAGHAIVPIGLATNGRPSEVLTLALHDRPDYLVGARSATWMGGVAGNGCSDTALLLAYRHAQSTEAFTALVERYRSSVFQASYRLLGTSQDAEDVTQQVFLALAQGQLQLQATLAGWLTTVTRNAAIALLRSRRRRASRERTAPQPAQPPSDLLRHDLREELEAALAQIPPAMRQAVELRYLQGLSQKEAARIAGCPRGTLAQRAARGIQKLRAILGIPPPPSAES
jgi:RNA polymerase sigma-70 factor (ECF subfamily)